MRIISQDGMYDFPYNNFLLSIDCSSDKETFFIFFKPVNYDGISKAIAAYSSKAKAEKAMGMLHAVYNDYVFMTNLNSFEILKAYANTYSREEFRKIAYPYFRFPKDKDLEV